MAVGDVYVFPGFLTPILTQLFFLKPPTTFLTCFCRGIYSNKIAKAGHITSSLFTHKETDKLLLKLTKLLIGKTVTLLSQLEVVLLPILQIVGEKVEEFS